MSGDENSSYRDYFESRERAIQYDTEQFNNGSYGDVLWRVEQLQLRNLVTEFRRSHPRIDYLDFAAGSGRIISFMEGLVDSATGIEISESMAELARQKLKIGRVVCRDITAADSPIESCYDFITAFRFVLNAEPSLRLSGLKALAGRLRDDTSWLIFNNHNYLWSHKMLTYPVNAWRRFGRGYQTSGNYLTHSQVGQLAEEAGLRIVRTMGCGLLSGRVTSMMTFERAVDLECGAASIKWLSLFGVNQMYVACRK